MWRSLLKSTKWHVGLGRKQGRINSNSSKSRCKRRKRELILRQPILKNQKQPRMVNSIRNVLVLKLKNLKALIIMLVCHKEKVQSRISLRITPHSCEPSNLNHPSEIIQKYLFELSIFQRIASSTQINLTLLSPQKKLNLNICKLRLSIGNRKIDLRWHMLLGQEIIPSPHKNNPDFPIRQLSLVKDQCSQLDNLQICPRIIN